MIGYPHSFSRQTFITGRRFSIAVRQSGGKVSIKNLQYQLMLWG